MTDNEQRQTVVTNNQLKMTVNGIRWFVCLFAEEWILLRFRREEREREREIRERRRIRNRER